MQNLLFGYNFAKDKIKETHSVNFERDRLYKSSPIFGIENVLLCVG